MQSYACVLLISRSLVVFRTLSFVSWLMGALLSQPLGFENSQAVIVPLFFLVSINLLFNNWAKDQVGTLVSLPHHRMYLGCSGHSFVMVCKP